MHRMLARSARLRTLHAAKSSKHSAEAIDEWAALTIPRSFWDSAFYRQQRNAGKSHQAAVSALAFKWIRIMHRCWITRHPYDEAIYLTALKQRGSPLLKFIAAADSEPS